MSKLYENVLLDQLPPHVTEELAPHLERVRLEALQVLSTPLKTLPHVYFPQSAIIGVLAPLSAEYHQLGLIGREGVINHVFPSTDDRMPWTMQVQVAGTAWRIRAETLALSAERHSLLNLMFLRSGRVEQIQFVSTGWPATRRRVEAGLARWLLMYFDRLNGHELRVTHEALAFVLGVRRPTITDALHIMEGEGVVSSKRSRIVLRDRQALIEISAPLYGLAEAEYQRLLGVDFRQVKPRETTLSVPEIIVANAK
ncbi:Crp/Fnr family transcriptional regulator [Agrobacterium sp. Azo12]|uniref:Crp/Fnr family transcriptional regulator n=1 Tax=Agrobacterium sp. Azo12 TaxID=3031129 RepID=UPI0023D7EE39|nr:Crp/Fnr family transcriptional regulator [Agrobacterium sp. Azo12]MDO5897190.1 Crp/Fnr family transcriptional regulator [Agrobacterium sp. Azo12]